VFKYEPLYNYLRKKPGPHIEMSFRDIERVISELLPKSAARPQWWANEPAQDRSHVQCAAWLDAGFKADAKPEQERVIFRKR
jgi:hypothetical protein